MATSPRYNTSSLFQVGDPVRVELHDASAAALEGVVSFVGKVKFADGTDWVGVRLTGASVGLGKNDGSVQGIRYFDNCGPNGGVFVRKTQVSKRTLTRLEELRLKRELNKPSSSISSSSSSSSSSRTAGKVRPGTTTTTTTTPSSSSSRMTPTRSTRSGMVSPKATVGVGGGGTAVATSSSKAQPARSRLEEIRARRAQAQAQAAAATGSSGVAGGVSSSTSSSSIPPPSTPAPTTAASSSGSNLMSDTTKARLAAAREKRHSPAKTTTAGAAGAIIRKSPSSSSSSAREDAALQLQVAELSTQLQNKVDELQQLQASLQKAQDEISTANARVEAASAEASEAKAEAARLSEEKLELQSELQAAAAAAKEEEEEEEKEVEEAEEEEKEVEVEEKEAGSEEQEEPREEEQEQEEIEEDSEEVIELKRERDDLQEELMAVRRKADDLEKSLAREKKSRTEASTESETFRMQLAALEDQLASASQQAAVGAEHYKEKAKLQAEIAAAHRRIKEMETEKVDQDTNIEELVLDKEQLQEEKEALEDRVEELMLDAETAQMEVEELKIELEKAKEGVDRAIRAAATGSAAGGDGNSNNNNSSDPTRSDADDMAQALAIQNARLRDALLRLREQSSQEKIELARQLRNAEKEVSNKKQMETEVASLRAEKSKLEDEIRELKETVDQGSALDGMVEELSDRLLFLEEEKTTLQTTIRELEDAADITAEMEEVQADENKALVRDLEGRDTIIRNLEEAIKVQRRREEDFQRTVRNYKKSIDVLKQEKSALLAMQEGGEGEKSSLLATSQKALARASQLVADTVEMRKKEAEAAFDLVEGRVQAHLTARLEALLPQSETGPELAAVKGELMLSKSCLKASCTLRGIDEIFQKTMRQAINDLKENNTRDDEEEKDATGGEEQGSNHLTLTDDALQQTGAMIHQAHSASATVDIGSYLLRVLCAGQWPDLLSPEESADVGARCAHSLGELDGALSMQLKILKEEGKLSPHQANIGSLEQAIKSTTRSMEEVLNNDGNPVVDPTWNPPAWELLKGASQAKFASLGAAAAVSSLAYPSDDQGASSSGAAISGPAVRALMRKLTKLSSETIKVGEQLVGLPVTDSDFISQLQPIVMEWKDTSFSLLSMVKSGFTGKQQQQQQQQVVDAEDVVTCTTKAEETLQVLLKMTSVLRGGNNVSVFAQQRNRNRVTAHPLSPESHDPWMGIVGLVETVRAVDGDTDDLNFLMRARTVQQKLSEALRKEPKLAVATAKVTSLEKSLSSRTKEIAMQNARLAELERLLSQTSVQPSPSKVTPSSDVAGPDASGLKEENRVLTEAIDVLQTQVDEYEAEIRTLKEGRARTPGKKAASSRRFAPFDVDFSSRIGKDLDYEASQAGGGGGSGSAAAKVGAIEAALFRPALRMARQDAAVWKARSIQQTMMNLPPLYVPTLLPKQQLDHDGSGSGNAGGAAAADADAKMERLKQAKDELAAASSEIRALKASAKVVDLSKSSTTTTQSSSSTTTLGEKGPQLQQQQSNNNDTGTAQFFKQRNQLQQAKRRLRAASREAQTCLADASGVIPHYYNNYFSPTQTSKAPFSSTSTTTTTTTTNRAPPRLLRGRLTIPIPAAASNDQASKQQRTITQFVQTNDLRRIHNLLL